MSGEYRIVRWTEPFPPNPAMLRFILESEGYFVYQWGDPPGSVYANHKHETDQVHWIVSGQMEICVERGGTHLLAAGDRDLMPANTYHSARMLGDENVVYLVGERVSG